MPSTAPADRAEDTRSELAHEIDKAAADATEWREIVSHNDDRGWDSLEEQQMAYLALIEACQALARLDQREEIRAELEQLRACLADINAEIAEVDAEGERWAKSAEIIVERIGPDIGQRVARCCGSPQDYAGIHAYCQHQLTNYDDLVDEAQMLGRE